MLIWDSKLNKPPSKKEREKAKKFLLKRLKEGLVKPFNKMIENFEKLGISLRSEEVQEFYGILESIGKDRIPLSELQQLYYDWKYQRICPYCLKKGIIERVIYNSSTGERTCSKCGSVLAD